MVNLVKVIDVSSYQSVEGLPGLIDYYQPDHVIVRLYQDDELPGLQDVSRAHIQTVLDKGKTLGGYGWLYGFGRPPEAQVDSMLDLLASTGQKIPVLWQDVETYTYQGKSTWPTQPQALAALRHTEDRGQNAGIYTGDYFVTDYWNGVIGEITTFPAWLANYDNNPVLVGSKYWLSKFVVGHQYQGNPIDLSVMDEQWTVMGAPPVEGDAPVPPTQPTYEDLQNLIGYLSGDVARDAESTLSAMWTKMSASSRRATQGERDHLAGLISVLARGAN